jgi:hypothetical protein
VAPAPGAGRQGRGREAVALAALVGAAALLRWSAWQRTAVLFDDGPRFLAIARAIDAGWWSAALRDSFHPLYPALTAGLHRVLGLDEAASWEAAGAAISVAAGAAAVGFLFLFLREAFGRGPAWAGAILLAVHDRAIEYASDVQSDGLYLACFAAGLWAGWRAWRTGRPAWAAAAGLASGLAYLTRPEGLGLVLVLGGLGLVSIVRGRWSLGAGAAWHGALGAAALLCVAPYVWALHELTGAWTLTHKKSVAALVKAEAVATPGAPAAPTPSTAPPAAAAGTPGQAPPPPPPPPWLDALGLEAPPAVAPEEMTAEYLAQDGLRVALAESRGARAWEALRMLARHTRSALRYGVLALVVAGLWASRGRPGPRAVYALAVLALYLAVLYALTVSAGYVSRRHGLPPLLPLFGWAGLGVLAAGAWAARAVRAPGRSPLAAALVLAAFAAGDLAGQWTPKRAAELPARRAAEWLREHAPAPGRVAASRQRLGYYAELPFVPLTGVADEALGRYLSRVDARYVLVEDPEQLAALRRSEGDAMRVLHEVEAAGGRAWVVERVPGEER